MGVALPQRTQGLTLAGLCIEKWRRICGDHLLWLPGCSSLIVDRTRLSVCALTHWSRAAIGSCLKTSSRSSSVPAAAAESGRQPPNNNQLVDPKERKRSTRKRKRVMRSRGTNLALVSLWSSTSFGCEVTLSRRIFLPLSRSVLSHC